MILHTDIVEQTVDLEERAVFVRDFVVARGPCPIAMVRKRAREPGGCRAIVLLVHGYGQNRYAWHLPSRSFSAYLARAGFDVYNAELRGSGRSAHLGARRAHALAEYVREDLPAAVEEARRLGGSLPVFLVGHSLGGLVSLGAAPRLDGAVGGVVAIGSPYHFTRGTRALAALGTLTLRFDGRLRARLRGRRPPVRLDVLGELMRIGRSLAESRFYPLPWRAFAPGSMEPQIFHEHMALAMDWGSLLVMRDMLRSAAERRGRWDAFPGGSLDEGGAEFEAADLPILVVAGARDDLAPPPSVKPAYDRSRSTDKTYRLLPHGHIDLLVGRDAPRTTWPLIEAWLRKRTR